MGQSEARYFLVSQVSEQGLKHFGPFMAFPGSLAGNCLKLEQLRLKVEPMWDVGAAALPECKSQCAGYYVTYKARFRLGHSQKYGCDHLGPRLGLLCYSAHPLGFISSF